MTRNLTFAATLRRLREKAGMTQAGLAKAAGMAQPAVARLEAGGRPDPRLSTLCALADALGVSLEAFRR